MGAIERLIAALSSPVVAVVASLIEKWGTKFIVALGTEAGIYWIVKTQPPAIASPTVTIFGMLAMAAVALVYFFVRYKSDVQRPTTKTEEITTNESSS